MSVFITPSYWTNDLKALESGTYMVLARYNPYPGDPDFDKLRAGILQGLAFYSEFRKEWSEVDTTGQNTLKPMDMKKWRIMAAAKVNYPNAEDAEKLCAESNRKNYHIGEKDYYIPWSEEAEKKREDGLKMLVAENNARLDAEKETEKEKLERYNKNIGLKNKK